MATAYAGNINTADPAELFRHIRDFLASASGIADYRGRGPGWTIVDESYASLLPSDPAAGDWCVLHSNGTRGEWPVYVKLTFGATRHNFKAYLGWDSASHTGAVEVYDADNIYHVGRPCILHMHADLDEICLLVRPDNQAYYMAALAGRLKHPLYSNVAMRVEEAIAAGTQVVITLPGWPEWAVVGRKIYSWDASGIAELEITETDAGAQKIVVAQASDRAAGSWLCEDVCVFVTSNYSSAANASVGMVHVVPGRVGNVGADTACTSTAGGLAAATGPDGKYGERVALDMFIGSSTSCRGHFGLIRETGAVTTAGEAWVDRDGRAWRLYPVYSGKYIAVLEAGT